MIRLRDYQTEAIAAIDRESKRGVTRQLVVLPTGAGKTIIFAHIIAARKEKALILAHRDELIEQAAQKMWMVWPEAEIGVIKAERNEHGRAVTIASVQTLSRANRLAELLNRNPEFGVVVVDEAHHAIAPQWLAVLEAVNAGRKSLLLGFTATPNRSDKAGLGSVFEKVVFERNIGDLVRAGYLVPPKGVKIKTSVDISGVSEIRGDLRESSLEPVINTANRNQLICDAYARYASGRKAIVFTAGVKHAYDLANAFHKNGISAAAIDGDSETSERRRVLQDFAAGRLSVLANCGVLTEGYDEPSVSCVILARPTKSQSLYIQQVGRGLRPYPGKRDCLVMDVADVSGKHKLVQLADLAGLVSSGIGLHSGSLGGGPRTTALDVGPTGKGLVFEETNLITSFAWRQIAGVWLLTLPDRRAIALRPVENGYVPVILEGANEVERLYPRPMPVEWAQGVAESRVRELYADGLALLRKKAVWRGEPASEKQVAILKRYGIRHGRDITKGEANDLITQALWGRNVRRAFYK